MARTADSAASLISKLLAQAENTSHPAEAETFMANAQMLATRHSIDLAKVRQTTARAQQTETVEFRHHEIGRAGQKSLRWFTALYGVIARPNDVEVVHASNSTSLDACGFPSDLDVVDAMYESLLGQMVRAGNAYIAEGGYKQERVRSRSARAYRPMHATTARASFYAGFVQRIGSRLREARKAAIAGTDRGDVTPTNDPRPLPSTAAVALRDKAAHVTSVSMSRPVFATAVSGRRPTVGSAKGMDAGAAAATTARLTDAPRAIGS